MVVAAAAYDAASPNAHYWESALWRHSSSRVAAHGVFWFPINDQLGILLSEI